MQALLLLNDPAYVECAQALARRIMREGSQSVEGRLTHAFRLCVSRKPQAHEIQRLAQLYQQQLSRYKEDRTAAEKMATSELGPTPEGMDVHELAAWTVVANVLLNLDETITKG